jgi:hypothetical protein
MDPDTGLSSPGDKLPEPILSITKHTTGNGYFQTMHFYYLIITDKRIICIDTDGLLDSRRKEIEEQRGGFFDLGFLPILEKLFGCPYFTTDFPGYFEKMHPAEIIAAYPDAEIIPFNNLTRFVITKGFFFPTLSAMLIPCWDIEITGRTKDGAMTIQLSTGNYPEKILENEALKKLLGTRYEFINPSFTTQIFGESRGF